MSRSLAARSEPHAPLGSFAGDRRERQAGRRAFAAALVAALVIVATAPVAAQQRTPAAASGGTRDTVPVIVVARVGRLAATTLEGYRSQDTALVPAAALLALMEVRIEHSGPTRVDAVLEPSGRALSFRADDPGAMVVDSTLFIDARALARAVEIDVAMDWSQLTVTFDDGLGRLPVTRRVARQAAHASLSWSDSTDTHPMGHPVPQARLIADGLVADYAAYVSGRDPRLGSYAVGIGAALLGGSLEGSLAMSSRTVIVDGPVLDSLHPVTRVSPTLRATGSWLGVWPAAWMTQLRLGEGVATGPRPRLLQGIAFTNAPFVRASGLGRIDTFGSFGPGWQIDVYEGGRLVGSDSTDALGRYRIGVPVQYGDNMVDVVAYGPHGEVRSLPRLLRVPPTLLPDHRFEYAASYGACPTALCRSTGNVDVRVGLPGRWTVRGGIESFRRDTIGVPLAEQHLYTSVVGLLTPALGLEVGSVTSVQNDARLWYTPSLALQVTLEGTQYSADVASRRATTLLAAGGRRDQLTLTTVLRPTSSASSLTLEGVLSRARTLDGSELSGRVGSSFHAGGVQLFPSVHLLDQHATGRHTSAVTGSLDLFATPRASWGTLASRTALRASIEGAPAGGLAGASVSGSLQLPGDTRLELGVNHVQALPGAIVTVGLTTSAAWGRTQVTSAHDARGASGSVAAQGAVLWDHAHGVVAFARGPAVSRAGISGRVCIDADGNGRCDPGEAAASHATLRIGSQQALTDEEGRYALYDLVPFEPITIAVDSASLGSPLWLPVHPTSLVTPMANRFVTVDIPLLASGTVEGRVVREGGGAAVGVGAMRVLLTRTGDPLVREATTFTDGTFAALGVPPGSYEVTLDAAASRSRGLFVTGPKVFIVVRSLTDGDTVNGVVLRVTRTSPPGATSGGSALPDR